jgi:hypothetical protein
MQAAFRVQLGIYHDGERFRSYAGPIHIPARVESVVQAILGLDTRRVGKPQFIRGNANDGYLPNQFGLFYGFPTVGNGAGQCIGILEFSSPNRPLGDAGYLEEDLIAAFMAMTLSLPTVTPVSVDGVNNHHGYSLTMTFRGAGPGAPVPGGGNLIRLTVDDASQGNLDDPVLVADVEGTVEANGHFEIQVVDSTHIDLHRTDPDKPETLFQHAYTGGGFVIDVQNSDDEVALDIQVAGGIAPGARQAVYFARNNDKGWVDAITKAVSDQINNPGSISISWSGIEEYWNVMARLAFDGALAEAAAIGVSVFAASGDELSTNGLPGDQVHVVFPASSLYAIGCGGTKISVAGTKITNEIVWNDGHSGTGGGISRVYPIPKFQSGVNLPTNVSTNKPGRGVPDVASNASKESGYKIYNDGQPYATGGTSAVAPLWAGLTALLNEGVGAPIGFFLQDLY